MKVKAIKVGWCGLKLRKVGEEFDYPVNKDKSNLGSWMEPVKQTKKPKKTKEEVNTDSKG